MNLQENRDFLKIAAQRFNAAETLFHAGLTLDAQLEGYISLECSLKALILEKTEKADCLGLGRVCSSVVIHRPETLLRELRILGVRLPPELAKQMRHFDWTTDLRYKTGRKSRGETRGFLRMCVEIHKWAREQLL